MTTEHILSYRYYLEVKLDVHVFPKTARIVIAQSFSISKGLK